MSDWPLRFRRWHRWLAWLVGLQLLAWIVGGCLFAWLPFQAWVKSAEDVAKPTAALPGGWAATLAGAELPNAPVLAVSSVPTAGGPAWQLRLQGRPELWLGADGRPLAAPDEAAVRRFASALYRGPGRLVGAERLEQPPRRLGIVRELGERRGVWVLRFDDALSTRLYVDARSGQFIAARNEAWVLYDFFWRLHIMDYSGDEDFNHPLLRSAALAALALLLSGGALLALWLARRRRQRLGPAPR